MQGTWGITIGSSDLADPSDSVVNPEGRDGGQVIAEYLGYGALAPIFINQGNGKFVSKWTITKTWSIDTAATQFYLAGSCAFSGVFTVTLSHVDYEAVTSEWVITGCKVELSVATPIGPTTITKLTLTGPAPVLQA